MLRLCHLSLCHDGILLRLQIDDREAAVHKSHAGVDQDDENGDLRPAPFFLFFLKNGWLLLALLFHLQTRRELMIFVVRH